MAGVRIVALSSAILTLIGGLAPVASAISPSETLLPNTTRGFVSITNVKTMVEHWNKTQLGQLAKDPVMKPFIDDLRMQIEERWSDIHEKLGVTIDDLRGVAGGELSIAAVQTANGRPALAIVVDVTGNLPNAKALLEKISKNLNGLKATHERIQLEGVPVDAFRFPPDEFTRLPKEEVSKSPKGKPKAKPAEPPDRYALYGLKDNLLVGSSQREVIQGILARAAGKKGPSLAEVAIVPGRDEAVRRRRRQGGSANPLVRPAAGLPGDHARLAPEADPLRKATNVAEFFKEQGFDAIQGFGGFVDFAAKPYEVVHRTAVYAPGKYEKFDEGFELPQQPQPRRCQSPGEDQFKPQSWVPAEVASYATFQFDILNAFDNLDPLVDALFGKGEKGVWKDLLYRIGDGRERAQDQCPQGVGRQPGDPGDGGDRLPGADHDDQRAAPVCRGDEARRGEGGGRRGHEALQERQGDAAAGIRRARGLGEHPARRKSKVEVPIVEIELPGLPGTKKPVRPERGGKRGHVLFPNVAVTVAHGQLLVASHYDFLIKVLGKEEARIKSGDTLASRSSTSR